MNKPTSVYVPRSRFKDKKALKDWCYANVSSTSNETTWTYNTISDYYKNKPAMTFNFFEASDAMAFKLRFGL